MLLIPNTNYYCSIRPFLVHYSKTMRTASLRILRYYLAKGPPGVAYIKEMISLRIHFFITRFVPHLLVFPPYFLL